MMLYAYNLIYIYMFIKDLNWFFLYLEIYQ